MERRILILRTVMMLALGLVMFQNTAAQDYVAPTVRISKDKVKIGGKVFYSHIVEERQTLYSISKAYNVTVEDILKHNPEVKEKGLRKNSIINIPVVDAPQQQIQQTQEPQQTQQAPQTQQDAPEEVLKGSKTKKHTVKWFEDLEGIALKYGVSEEDIVRINGLKDKKLRNRQVLLIPVSKEATMQESAHETFPEIIEKENTPAKAIESSDGVQSSTDPTVLANIWRMLFKSKVNATLILPFKATGTSSSRNHMDFYSGVLLAAKEMEDSNIELNLKVYDIAAGISGIPAQTLRNSDMVIGPIAPNDITQINAVAGGACPIISPLDQRAEELTSRYRNLIQVPSSQYAQYEDLADWIKEDLKSDDTVIVITEKDLKQNEAGRTVKSIMSRNQIAFNSFSYNILEGREIQERIEAQMTATGVNRVIIASDSEAFVNDAVRNLNLIVHNKFQIVLYAPAKIRTFETIEVENFHNTSLHASLTFNIDYDDLNVKNFVRRYRAMFGAEPTQFAFQGYDITKYFATLVARYNQGWMAHLPEEDAQMLQSSFKFRSKGSGGYVNNGIRRIIYGEDYSIEEVL